MGDTVIVWWNVSRGKIQTEKQQKPLSALLAGEFKIVDISEYSIRFARDVTTLARGGWVDRDDLFIEFLRRD